MRKFLNLLGRRQLYDIHSSSLEVLERTGIIIREKEALNLLDRAGAKVDYDGWKAWIPAHLIEEMVKRAPRRFTLHARDARYNIRLGVGAVYFGVAGTIPYILDLEGERRPATLRDAEDLARLVDVMENVHEGYCIVHPQDVPEAASHAYMFLATAKNTGKALRGRMYGAERVKSIVEMAAILGGCFEEIRKKPNLYAIANPVSPLTYSREQLEGMVLYARAGLPVAVSSCVQAGMTGPVTLAGTLVQLNAEVLAGITILELAEPGAPVLYGVVSSITDPRRGSMAYGAIELGLLSAAGAQMAKFYGLPCRGSGGATDSCTIDMQSGYESALTVLLPAQAGVDLILYGVGGLESALTASYEKVVIDNDVLGMVKRALRGIEVDEGSLATEIIHEVGPGGFFLSHRQTLQLLQKEHFIPQLSNRMRYEAWKTTGIKDIRELAREKVREILKKHQPSPLDKDVERRLEAIVKNIARSS